MIQPMLKYQWALYLLFAATVAGCAEMIDPGSTPKAGPAPLRVGVTPTNPPLIFINGGRFDGVEVELARLLAARLDRPLQFVSVDWKDQIPTLLAGRTDIIMSAMTVTEARKVRIRFTEPYFNGGLSAMIRTEDAGRYTSRESLGQGFVTIGVIGGTTGDVAVQRNFPNARKIELLKASDAPSELRRRAIDIFVYDAPAIMWLVSENEADLMAIEKKLSEEQLAWGIRREDQGFLAQINAILTDWKRDGTLDRVLTKWIPVKKNKP